MAASGKRKEPAAISIALITLAFEEEEAEARRQAAAAASAPVSATSSAPPAAVHAPVATGPDDPGVVAKPPTAPSEATSLSLSFRGLLKVENLQMLTSLRRLRLDNNALTRIEGLESCANLEWLDLSFNKLRAVEGLGHLAKLRDLSLYNNELTSPKGLADGALGEGAALQCLSLGNNLMLRLEDTVVYLRKLRGLEVLTLEGNPLCKPGEGQRTAYKPFCHAFLPRLKYLDYEMVTAAEKASARDGGVPAEVLQEVEDADAREERAALKARERAEQVAALQAMNIEVAETLVDEIMDQDPDFQKVKGMPGMPQAVQTMREAVKPAAETLKVVGAEKDALIRAEIDTFADALSTVTAQAHADTAARVKDWERRFKHASRDLYDAEQYATSRAAGAAAAPAAGGKKGDAGGGKSESAAEDELRQLLADAAALEAWAVRLELETHESVEAMLDAFETAMVELRAAKVANHETFFRAVEASEGVFTDALQKLAEKVVADFAKGSAHVDDEELSNLLGDKEQLFATMGQSHETRVAKILKSESDLRLREERRCGGAVLDARKAELARNRGRLFELRGLKETFTKRCKELL
jgi:hypothetical protein